MLRQERSSKEGINRKTGTQRVQQRDQSDSDHETRLEQDDLASRLVMRVNEGAILACLPCWGVCVQPDR